MVWAIIALAVMNISTIVTIVYNQRESGKDDPIVITANNQTVDESMKYSGRYFRDQLNLRRDQMSEFVQFNPSFRQKMMTININLGRVRKEMLTEMCAEKSDINKLNLYSDSIGYLHSDLKKLTYRYYIDIKNICTPVQQEKLKQMFVEMFENDLQVGQHGPGPQNGRRFGRRMNN